MSALNTTILIARLEDHHRCGGNHQAGGCSTASANRNNLHDDLVEATETLARLQLAENILQKLSWEGMQDVIDETKPRLSTKERAYLESIESLVIR